MKRGTVRSRSPIATGGSLCEGWEVSRLRHAKASWLYVLTESPVLLHSRGPDASSLVLCDGLQSTRTPISLLAAQEVQIEAAAERAVRQCIIAQQPFLAVSITSIDTMACCRRLGVVASLLIEWVSAI